MSQQQEIAAVEAAFAQYMNTGFAVKGGDVAALLPTVAEAAGGNAPGAFRVVLDFDQAHNGWHAVFHTP